MEGDFETLLGRNWFDELFGESWLQRLMGVNRVSREMRTIEELKRSKIFTTELGTVKGVEAQIIMRKGHQPKYTHGKVAKYELFNEACFRLAWVKFCLTGLVPV